MTRTLKSYWANGYCADGTWEVRELNTDGVLDEEVWGRLAGIIDASHDLDPELFATRARSFSEEIRLPGHQRAGLYVWYLLRNALGGKVGGRVPSDVELMRISHDYFARFKVVLDRADRPVVEDTFRKVFERAPLTKRISPGELLVLGSAALGVLYEDRRSRSALSSTTLFLQQQIRVIG